MSICKFLAEYLLNCHHTRPKSENVGKKMSQRRKEVASGPGAILIRIPSYLKFLHNFDLLPEPKEDNKFRRPRVRCLTER